MRPIKAKFKKRGSELPIIIQRIKERMVNNPVFANPPEALAELIKMEPEFLLALANAEGRDKHMVSIKKDKMAIVLNKIQEVADYVTETCKGDRTMILSSGFDVTGETTGDGNQAPAIKILLVELGQSGEATTRAKNVTGAKAYVHQYTKEQPGLNSEWIGIGSSQSNYTFEGLTSDKRYWFRVVAIGTDDQRGYSPVISKVIQ